MITLETTRAFGATGVRVPLIGYGTAPLGKQDNIPFETGVACLHHALDKGITYIDTSPDYGSEPVVGEVMKTRRAETFLATKINNRSYNGVREELEKSLKKLQTDHVDLIQIHAVNTWADWEQIIAPDGALTALEEARAEGLVRFIGITGHTRPEILANALRCYDFDSVLVALGIADRLVSSPETFLLPVAQEKNTAVIAMKVFGHGAFSKRDLALRYSLGLPQVSLAILGLNSERHIDEAVKAANELEELSDDDLEELIQSVRPLIEAEVKGGAPGKLFWLRDIKVNGWAQKDEPMLVEY